MPAFRKCSGHERFKPVERAGPAPHVAITRSLIEQLFVLNGQQGTVAIRLQRYGDLRFPLRRRMPCPAENQSLLRHHFAIGATALVMLAVIGGEADAESTADAHIEFSARR